MTTATSRTAIRRGLERGFTLLELIVVITIIGLLGTLVVVRVGGVLGRANKTKIMNDLQAIVNAAEMYRTMEGYYPETIEELVEGKSQDGTETVGLDLKQDPWGNDYYYELSNGKPRAYCLGQDGQQGGEGDNQDYFYPEEGDLDF